MSKERFISERIAPVAGSFDASGMARGGPGLPRRFVWRDAEYEVGDVLEAWVSSTPECAGGELYLRRHWWRLRLRAPEGTSPALGEVVIYCERQSRRGQSPKARWFLYTSREA